MESESINDLCIVGTHKNSYRRGQVASVLGLVSVDVNGEDRPAYKVGYIDGTIDYIAVSGDETYVLFPKKYLDKVVGELVVPEEYMIKG